MQIMKRKISQVIDSCAHCRGCYKFKKDGEEAAYVYVCVKTGKVLTIENTAATPFIAIPDDCPLPDTEHNIID